MVRNYLIGLAVGAAGFLGVAADNGAHAALMPQVDFRDSLFSAADGNHSFSATVDGIGFTISAYRINETGLEAANIWWDSIDGLGIWGGTNDDEIDRLERLVISFDNVVALSDIFVADFFASEEVNGQAIDETGFFQLDDNEPVWFSGSGLAASEGDKTNGEGVITLGKTTLVHSITFGAFFEGSQDGHDFAVLGFTDPPIPEPATAGVFGFGLLGLGLLRRARNRRRKS